VCSITLSLNAKLI